MKVFKQIHFALSPKFGKVHENDPSGLFYFDWFIFKDDPNDPTEWTGKQKLLLFQMFIAQQALELANNHTTITRRNN